MGQGDGERRPDNTRLGGGAGSVGDDGAAIACVCVVQFNKRDLEDIKPLEEIREAWKGTGVPTVPAVALKGEGVIETFQALLEILYHTINRRHDFAKQFGVTEQAFLNGILRHLDEPKPDAEDPSE